MVHSIISKYIKGLMALKMGAYIGILISTGTTAQGTKSDNYTYCELVTCQLDGHFALEMVSPALSGALLGRTINSVGSGDMTRALEHHISTDMTLGP